MVLELSLPRELFDFVIEDVPVDLSVGDVFVPVGVSDDFGDVCQFYD